LNKILIVDDDKNLLEVIRYNLVNEGYSVILAENGTQAVEIALQEKPELIILDIMLPGIDGFDVCRILRKEMSVPILMLSAKIDEIDKVVGLELGADDYIAKPFSVRELMARVRASLRRGQLTEQNNTSKTQDETKQRTILKGHDLELDAVRHNVSLKGAPLVLTPKEFELLAFLMRNKGQVFGREQLMEKVWGYTFDGSKRTVDVHIRWLRQKIEDNPEKPKILITIIGFGYKFEN
jgi:Response regulators consisting of a CheY-like receiver domain and a winged-helix DNA-binding domain